MENWQGKFFDISVENVELKMKISFWYAKWFFSCCPPIALDMIGDCFGGAHCPGDEHLPNDALFKLSKKCFLCRLSTEKS